MRALSRISLWVTTGRTVPQVMTMIHPMIKAAVSYPSKYGILSMIAFANPSKVV